MGRFFLFLVLAPTLLAAKDFDWSEYPLELTFQQGQTKCETRGSYGTTLAPGVGAGGGGVGTLSAPMPMDTTTACTMTIPSATLKDGNRRVAQVTAGAPDKRSLSGIRFSDLSGQKPGLPIRLAPSIAKLARHSRKDNIPRRAKNARLGHPWFLVSKVCLGHPPFMRPSW